MTACGYVHPSAQSIHQEYNLCLFSPWEAHFWKCVQYLHCNLYLSWFLQVVEKLIRGLAMEDSRNMFALFEHNQQVDRAVESRVIVADILAKFER